VLAALAIAGLLAVDAQPALRGLPLVLLMLAAVIQMGRELAVAAIRRGWHLSTPVMNFWSAIVVLHLIYFSRSASWSAALELTFTVLVALFTLVLVAALTTDYKAHGWLLGLRDVVVSLLVSTLLSLGLGCAAWLQAGSAHLATPDGSQRLAVLLLAVWAGAGLARLLETRGTDDPRPPATLPGLLARLLVGAAVAAAALKVGPAAGAAAGLAAAAAAWVGHKALDALARWCQTPRFLCPLPHQFAALQPLYNRLFDSGVLDYGGGLVAAYPVAWLVLRALAPTTL
jgi:hypothetical protein